MAEATALNPRKAGRQGIEDFIATHATDGTGGLMFLLLAIFVIWPIISVLVKSISGPNGITLKYYQDFVTHKY